MQSGEYIISADMKQSYRKIDLEEANILLQIAYFPQQTCITMINKLIFDPRSYSPKVNINIKPFFNNNYMKKINFVGRQWSLSSSE